MQYDKYGRINYALLKAVRFGNYGDDRGSVQVDFTPNISVVVYNSVRKLETLSLSSLYGLRI